MNTKNVTDDADVALKTAKELAAHEPSNTTQMGLYALAASVIALAEVLREASKSNSGPSK